MTPCCSTAISGIQGTSSTKYPSQHPLHLVLPPSVARLDMSGRQNVLEGNKYIMRPGAVPVPIVCSKSDYSDSSMSLNTGGAKLFNDVMKELGCSRLRSCIKYERGRQQSRARSTCAPPSTACPSTYSAPETTDGENVYYGQYNLNNGEKQERPGLGWKEWKDF